MLTPSDLCESLGSAIYILETTQITAAAIYLSKVINVNQNNVLNAMLCLLLILNIVMVFLLFTLNKLILARGLFLYHISSFLHGSAKFYCGG